MFGPPLLTITGNTLVIATRNDHLRKLFSNKFELKLSGVIEKMIYLAKDLQAREGNSYV